MSVTRINSGKESGIACMLLDAIGVVLDANVLGLVLEDDQGVSIMPLPAAAKALFEYLGSVDWKRARLEASEHLP